MLEPLKTQRQIPLLLLLPNTRAFLFGCMQVLLHNSKQLDDAATLAQAGVTDGSTLTVSARLLGGGGDGGSTGAESRSCYLEMYAEKKPDKVGEVVVVGRGNSSSCAAVQQSCCTRKTAAQLMHTPAHSSSTSSTQQHCRAAMHATHRRPHP